MSALFTAVININLELQKQNAGEKHCAQTTAINHLVIVTEHLWHLYGMGQAGDNTEHHFRVTLE